jgi:hypothetical protein
MVARRTLALLVALITAAFVAGCAQTVTGHASFADSAGGGGTPTSSDSSSPSTDSSSSDGSGSSSPDTTDSTDSSGSTDTSSGSTDSSGSDDGDKSDVCGALDKGEVERLLGGSVTLKKSQSTGCQVTSSNGKSLIVAVFDFLTLAEYKKGTFTNLKVGGHPAIRTDSNIIYCARSTNPADDGLLAAYYSGLGDNGQVASALLAQLLKKYSR